MAHQARAYPDFCSIKQLEVFLLPLDGMLQWATKVVDTLLGKDDFRYSSIRSILFASSVKSLIPPAPNSMLCRRYGLHDDFSPIKKVHFSICILFCLCHSELPDHTEKLPLCLKCNAKQKGFWSFLCKFHHKINGSKLSNH